MVLPPGIEWVEDACYGIHLATAVTLLTGQQENMILDHLAIIPGFSKLMESVTAVDYSDFQYFGNYRDQVLLRVNRNFK